MFIDESSSCMLLRSDDTQPSSAMSVDIVMPNSGLLVIGTIVCEGFCAVMVLIARMFTFKSRSPHRRLYFGSSGSWHAKFSSTAIGEAQPSINLIRNRLSSNYPSSHANMSLLGKKFPGLVGTSIGPATSAGMPWPKTKDC